MKIKRLLGWGVLVVPNKAETRTASGIELSTMSALPPSTGSVLAMSRQALKDYPMLTLFARVHFKPYGGLDLEIQGKKLKLLRKEDLLGFVDEIARPCPEA